MAIRPDSLFRRTASFFLAAVVAVGLGLSIGGSAQADDFRIDTKVTMRGKVVTENLTVFYGGRVYDFMGGMQEVTIFDPARTRFLLLDPSRSMRTEVQMNEVLTFMDRLQSWAREEQDPFMNFLADPKFEQAFDPKTNALTMTSQFLTYRLHAVQAPNAGIHKQYSDFSDWYARISTMATVGKMPPFPRMAVNAAMKQQRLIPTDVTLTLHLKEDITLHSDHKIGWRLLEEDMKRIRQVDDYVTKFKAAPLEEFLRPVEQAPPQQSQQGQPQAGQPQQAVQPTKAGPSRR